MKLNIQRNPFRNEIEYVMCARCARAQISEKSSYAGNGGATRKFLGSGRYPLQGSGKRDLSSESEPGSRGDSFHESLRVR